MANVYCGFFSNRASGCRAEGWGSRPSVLSMAFLMGEGLGTQAQGSVSVRRDSTGPCGRAAPRPKLAGAGVQGPGPSAHAPPPSLQAEAAVAAVAVADTVRDGVPPVGPGGTPELWGRGGACAAAPGPSAAASFFVRYVLRAGLWLLLPRSAAAPGDRGLAVASRGWTPVPATPAGLSGHPGTV